MSILTFISQIFQYFFSSFLSIYGQFFGSLFTDTGDAIQQLAQNMAHQLGYFGIAMPIVLVLPVGFLIMAFYAMLMVTAMINSALE